MIYVGTKRELAPSDDYKGASSREGILSGHQVRLGQIWMSCELRVAWRVWSIFDVVWVIGRTEIVWHVSWES